jgi:hypothetical protein
MFQSRLMNFIERKESNCLEGLRQHVVLGTTIFRYFKVYTNKKCNTPSCISEILC